MNPRPASHDLAPDPPEPGAAADDLVGLVVGGRYRIVAPIGEGGMGRVYAGVHQDLGRPVAIKLLKAEADPDGPAARRFEQEAQAASRLNHPHIVSVIGFGRTAGGLHYLVTEFLEGEILFDLIERQGALPLARTLDIFHQILAAVEEAHSFQVIHRDLKPENVMVLPLRSGGDFVKVLDFGIATFVDETTQPQTILGGLVGTPGFIAPETYLRREISTRSDIYALGAVLFEMLTGLPPYRETTPEKLLSLHAHEPPRTLSEAAPTRSFGADLEQVVRRALAKDPAGRYASVAELRSALIDAATRLGPVKLHCDACHRPRDPATGLCSHHGAVAAPTLLQISHRPAVASQTRPRVDRDALTASLSSGLVGRGRHALVLAEFLLGSQSLLEIVGPTGSERPTLCDRLSAAAASLGHTVLHLRADPWQALRPWYPVRRLIGDRLGCGPDPESADAVVRAAAELGVPRHHHAGLALLFGRPRLEVPTDRAHRLMAIQQAAFAVLLDAPSRFILAEDVFEYDRASQFFLRYLLARGDDLQGKIVTSSVMDFWPAGDRHPTVRADLVPTDYFERRLVGLPGAALDVLGRVCALGAEVPPDLVGDEGSVRILTDRGLLQSEAAGTLSPASAVLARTVLDGISPLARRRLHADLFQRLRQAQAPVFVLAIHAEQAGLDTEAFDLWRAAADQACIQADHETAAFVHYPRATKIARWRLLWAEDEEPYLDLAQRHATVLSETGHVRAAEAVFKEVIGGSARFPHLQQQAHAGLAALEESAG